MLPFSCIQAHCVPHAHFWLWWRMSRFRPDTGSQSTACLVDSSSSHLLSSWFHLIYCTMIKYIEYRVINLINLLLSQRNKIVQYEKHPSCKEQHPVLPLPPPRDCPNLTRIDSWALLNVSSPLLSKITSLDKWGQLIEKLADICPIMFATRYDLMATYYVSHIIHELCLAQRKWETYERQMN